jgi:hypothetical protein
MSEIIIRHTHAEGTLVEGMTRGDGSYEILTANGFRWFRSLGTVGVRQSRDHVAKRWVINAAANLLRAAGHEVEVVIDDTHRDRATVLDDRGERLDDRGERLDAAAVRQRAESEALWDHSHRLVEHRPLGQPILVGHHSEGRDRRLLERAQNASFKALYRGRDADRTELAAAAVGTDATSAATPAATARRIVRLETERRGLVRSLDGYTDKWGSVHTPATGDRAESLNARLAQLDDQLAYDRGVVATADAAGKHVTYGPHNVKAGDLVRTPWGWRLVKKVNKVTVSSATEYTWDDKIKFVDILGHRPADS